MHGYREEYLKLIRESCKEIDRINESKEILRIALVNKGFDIPEGLKLIEWIPYIEKGVRT